MVDSASSHYAAPGVRHDNGAPIWTRHLIRSG